MYASLIFLHNLTRWLVLASLLVAIYRAYQGYTSKAPFMKTDDAVRHWTATIAHIQLLIGMTLYFQSPIIQYVFSNFREAIKSLDLFFFTIIHSLLMLTAVIVITVGSSMAKRKTADQEKFRVMLILFAVGLAIIFMAIPWPFSPLANRPLFR